MRNSGPLVEERSLPNAPPAPSPRWRDPRYQAFLVLWAGFSVAPVLFGLDKFFKVMTDWERYLAPAIRDVLPMPAATFMMIVGVVEVAAGVFVALRPRVFAYVVSAWLLAITANLVLGGEYYDVALRDVGLAMGALALGRMAQGWHRASA